MLNRLFTRRRPIHRTKRLSDAERYILFGWGSNIFLGDHLNLEWHGHTDWHYLYKEKRKAVGHIGSIQTEVTVGADQIPVIGIGAVMVLPEFRGRKIAEQLVTAVCDDKERQQESDFVFLFCLDHLVGYYAKQHFSRLTTPVLLHQPDGPIECPLNCMVRAPTNKDWPSGDIMINQLPW